MLYVDILVQVQIQLDIFENIPHRSHSSTSFVTKIYFHLKVKARVLPDRAALAAVKSDF